MSRGFKIVVALIGVSVLLAVIYLILPPRIRSSRFDRYLCERCAMKREVISRWWLGIPVRGRDTIISTSLSRQMAAGETAKCEHTWVSVYFDSHGIREAGHGGANSPFAIYVMTEDDIGATGLMTYARETGRRPDIVWNTLLHYLAEYPRGKTSYFETWLLEGNIGDSGEIAAWLRRNYKALEAKKK